MVDGMSDLDLEAAMGHAVAAVRAAAHIELAHFQRGLTVELKSDRSPVTIADREGEATIIASLKAAYPDHGFFGEESGGHAESSRYRWIIDPIDGTRGFTRGGSFWGPLLALTEGDRVLVGAMALPALNEVYVAARGHGAWKNGRRVHVSQVTTWPECTLSVGELRGLLQLRERGVLDLMQSAASVRCYGDLAGAAMVIDGRADVWIEAGVQVWDLAPIAVLIEEAGGRFTDLDGAPTIRSGHAIASNGALHAHALAAMTR